MVNTAGRKTSEIITSKNTIVLSATPLVSATSTTTETSSSCSVSCGSTSATDNSITPSPSTMRTVTSPNSTILPTASNQSN